MRGILAVGLVAWASSAMAGEFSKVATVALFQGKWLTPAQRAAFLREADPDRIVAAFPAGQQRTLALVGLDIGFDAIRTARSQPGVPVPLPDKDAELIFRWQTDRLFSTVVHRPVLAVRVLKLKAPPTTPALPGGGMPGGAMLPR